MGHKQTKGHSTGIVVILVIIAVCAIVAAAFAGIQPLATYKDYVIGKVSPFLSQVKSANVSITPIATTERIYTDVAFHDLCIELKPTTLAKANYKYQVELFEKGKLRTTQSLTWNQPEINVKYTKVIRFSLTEEEFNAYYGHRLDNIFSVDVHE